VGDDDVLAIGELARLYETGPRRRDRVGVHDKRSHRLHGALLALGSAAQDGLIGGIDRVVNPHCEAGEELELSVHRIPAGGIDLDIGDGDAHYRP
jgi:hypothetical protein